MHLQRLSRELRRQLVAFRAAFWASYHTARDAKARGASDRLALRLSRRAGHRAAGDAVQELEEAERER